MAARGARRARVGAAVLSLSMVVSCTAILGIDKDYHKDSEGSGGDCFAPEGSFCVKACSGNKDPACSPYVCVKGGCLRSCDSDADCSDAAYCDARICALRKKSGESCGGARECEEGHCENGICCLSECGICQDCVAGLGICQNIFTGQNDRDSCVAPRACDGEARCLAAAGDPCASSNTCLPSLTCVDGVCCDKACDVPCVACNLAEKEGTCSPIEKNQFDTSPVCGGLSDKTHACNGEGSCTLVRGQTCKVAADCVSGDCSGMPLKCQ